MQRARTLANGTEMVLGDEVTHTLSTGDCSPITKTSSTATCPAEEPLAKLSLTEVDSPAPEDSCITAKDLQLPTDCFPLPRQNVGFQIPYFLSSVAEVSRIRPPAVVKTWETRFGELSAKQQQAFHEYVVKVKAAQWYDAAKHDDWTCLRYLSARQYDLRKAFDMLANSAKWRMETGSDDWICEACVQCPNGHMSQFVGWDRQHRPVLYMSMRWGPERKEPMKHMVCAFNHLVRMMPEGVEQWVCLSDFETYSHLRDGKPSMGLSVIRTIQDHFPERLGNMICINPPTMFWVLYKLFYPVIDPATRTKVLFLYTEDKPSVYDAFPSLFPDHLSQFLYDSYHRSKHNMPAVPLVWRPAEKGYPADFEERKAQLKEQKKTTKEDRVAKEREAKAQVRREKSKKSSMHKDPNARIESSNATLNTASHSQITSTSSDPIL